MAHYYFYDVFWAIGFVVELVVVLIQFYLTIIAPLVTVNHTLLQDWNISYASTLFSLQMILLSNLFAENFGGPLNHIFEGLMITSRWGFLEQYQFNFQK